MLRAQSTVYNKNYECVIMHYVIMKRCADVVVDFLSLSICAGVWNRKNIVLFQFYFSCVDSFRPWFKVRKNIWSKYEQVIYQLENNTKIVAPFPFHPHRCLRIPILSPFSNYSIIIPLHPHRHRYRNNTSLRLLFVRNYRGQRGFTVITVAVWFFSGNIAQQ